MILCRPPDFPSTNQTTPCAISFIPNKVPSKPGKTRKIGHAQSLQDSSFINGSSGTEAPITGTGSLTGSPPREFIDNVVPVVDLRGRRKQYSRGPEVNFTICVPPLHHPHYTWMDIVKFIEINRILGK